MPPGGTESNGVVRAAGGMRARNPGLVAVLALLMVSVAVLVALLGRRAITRPGGKGPG